eukprot:scaffold5983_cov62-Cyclotella_meneghiniana.AAC.2
MFARAPKRFQTVWLLACSFAGFATYLWNLNLGEFVALDNNNYNWSNGTATEHSNTTHRHISPDDGECIPMHDSEEHPHPNGNTIHELDFFSKYIHGEIQHIAKGGVNDVFHYKDPPTGKSLVVKIRMLFRKISHDKYYAVGLDSIIMDRLTKSPHIFDIHGYCGFALILPFVSGGTLGSKMQKWRDGEIHLDSMTRLQYALNITRALRDLHNLHGDGVPSVIHGDLNEHQYLFDENGRLLLGDFNKGQSLYKSPTTGKPCTYQPPFIGTRTLFRAPEEYLNMQQSAASDVFALGSLLYNLITGVHVWDEWLGTARLKQVRQMIMDGKRPKIKRKIRESKHPVNVALITAYDMCTQYDPEQRSSAKEVSEYLENVWKELDPDDFQSYTLMTL